MTGTLVSCISSTTTSSTTRYSCPWCRPTSFLGCRGSSHVSNQKRFALRGRILPAFFQPTIALLNVQEFFFSMGRQLLTLTDGKNAEHKSNNTKEITLQSLGMIFINHLLFQTVV